MRPADVCGTSRKMVFQWTQRNNPGRNVPHVRLAEDADLKKIFTLGKKLGQGSFGVVNEATHIETQIKWAIKKICKPEPGSTKVELLEQEVSILKQVNHANIIHLKEVFETPLTMYLVTELCDGGNLRELLQRKTFFIEDETRHIIQSLAGAIVYLHKRDIVHRDLKLENILVKGSLHGDDYSMINIKVTDFGLSVKTDGVGIEISLLRDTVGTFIYMAPEMINDRGYSQWCDVWSIGVIMYMLLCGEPPFFSKSKTKLFHMIMKGELQFTQPIWNTVSNEAKHVLTHLLQVDPACRMSANQLLDNPWITGDNNMLPPNAMDIMLHDYLRQKDQTSSEDVPVADANQPKESSSDLQQGERNSNSNCDAQLLPQPPAKQPHAGVKASRQPSARQHRPQDRRDTSKYTTPFAYTHKAERGLRKAEGQRPSTSSKSRMGSLRLPAGSDTKMS
ncbi:serine/threonine-protein kinase 33 [Genypterus blacodes]|uniref:serine/threonine-protein kinase 33 n=1 Tax=Genypterus blacodes TaxID=154954 RepID=UPI003F77005C